MLILIDAVIAKTWVTYFFRLDALARSCSVLFQHVKDVEKCIMSSFYAHVS